MIAPILLLSLLDSKSQNLNIGDKAPPVEINATNYISNKLNLGDLKGKLVILDFWSHICASCIKSFSRIDSLQKIFGEKIQIILVNKESSDATDLFFKLRKKLKRPNLPFVCGDTILHKLFPHYSVPYHVWIDSKGIIRYMTDGFTATKENIDAFLSDNYFQARNFKTIKYVPSLFDSIWINSLDYFSYISTCIEGIHLSASKKQGYEQISVHCASIAELYQKAFNESDEINFKFSRPGRLILEVLDSFSYQRPKNSNLLTDWYQKKNSYNYHLLLPQNKASEKYKIMQADLNRYFGLSASIETRRMPTLVLVRTSNANKLLTKGNKSNQNFYWTTEQSIKFDSIRYFNNQPYTIFSKRFGYYLESKFNLPFIDATGITQAIDIKFSGISIDSANLQVLRKELNKYDLDILEIEYPLEVLVIKL